MKSNVLGGLLAKRNGEMFERMLRYACNQSDISLIDLPDGAAVRTVRGRPVTVRVKSPFDAILLGPNGKCAFVDTKTRVERICYSDFFRQKSKHQLLNLLECERRGNWAGFVVWFRPSDEIRFFPAGEVIDMPKRSSYDCEDGYSLGTLDEFHVDRIFDL